ncbi:MAG TPA: alpha-galactosidase [Terriglobales bacterium]|nr:alpha-galactosidase [Terriglobales bacterium]
MKSWLLVMACTLTCWHSALGANNPSSWRLSTDDTTIVVEVQQGIPVLTWLGAKSGGTNWLLGTSPETLLPEISQHGSSTKTSWTFDGGAFDSQSGQLILRFSNSTPALELQSVWRARPGRGPIEHWLTIANNSGAPITIGHQDSLVLSHLTLPADESLDAWSIKRGAGNATLQGGTITRSVGKNSNETLTSNPNDGASPVPWLALQAGTSHGLYVGWEFSGIGRIHFQTFSGGAAAPASDPAPLKIEVGNVPEFQTDVPAGETFLVPPAFVGCYTGDIDDGSYSLHRFIMEKLVPRYPKGYEYPTLAYNLYLDSGGADAEEKGVLASAALAHELGFETFVVDAMWFPESGAWFWDPKRFPHGHHAIEEYLHSHNMKFGLWMAYTQGATVDDPRSLNIDKHRDWFFAPPKPDPDHHINWDAQVDLGSDQALDWVKQSTQRVVSEYKIDYFKTDYTPIATKCEQTTHRHHYGVDVSYWSTLGYYAVQEALLEKFPDLINEGCSGSGSIKDFGDIQRVHMIAMNDTLSSLPNRQGTYDATFAFPPAALMNYTYENFYDTVSDAPEPYFWRSSMMNAWQIDPTHSAGWTQKQRDGVKRATEVYKSWVRPMLKDAQVHHILPRPDGYHWDGMFYWSPSLKHGTLYIFRPNSDETARQVSLRGLSSGKRYKVRTEDHSTAERIYSGAELMDAGLSIHLAGKYTSDLIYIEEAE